MRGIAMRKLAVLRHVARLPEAQQRAVRALYASYDRLEYATIMPLYVMMMGSVVLPMVYATQITEHYGITMLAAVICSAIIWVALCAAVWFGSVQPRRLAHKQSIREIIGKDVQGRRAYETLRRLDPDMARNCGKILT